MKDATNSLTGLFFSFRRLTLGLVFSAMTLPGTAQIITLADHNSTVQVDVGSQNGMFNWSVEGQNQLRQQWFWFGIGNGPEAAINTISAASVNTPNSRTLYTTYANVQLSIEIDYTLTGGSMGSGVSDIGESIRIHNLSASPLSLHFFQYSDFDLAGSLGGDSISLGKNLQNTRFNDAYQTDGILALTETVVSPGANHGEAAFFGQTLGELNDATQTILNDSVGPLGPGNVTWALQWDLNIAAGGTALISKDKYLEIPSGVTPEPSTFALTGLGLAAFILLKRRQSK
jgi:hypothetical protein